MKFVPRIAKQTGETLGFKAPDGEHAIVGQG
jgi:hypothetical protein